MTDISQAPNFVFDAGQFAPDQGQPVIPADKYLVTISNTELKQTKDGKGAYFDCSYQVAEGPFAGSILHDRFNIMNDNAQTVRIAYGQLSALCHAVGIYQVSMQNQGANLRGARLIVDVVIRNGEQGPQNDVKRRYDAMGNEPGKTGPRPAPAGGPAPGPLPGQPGGFPGGQPQGGMPQAGWQQGPTPQAQGGAPAGFQPQPAPQAGFQPQPGPAPAGWQQGGAPAQGGWPAGQQPQGPQAGGPAPAGWPAGQPTQAAPQQQPAGPAPGWGQQPQGAPQGGPAPGQPAWSR